MNNVDKFKLKFNFCTNKSFSSVVQSSNHFTTPFRPYIKTKITPQIIAKGDSGATKTYLTTKDMQILKNKKKNEDINVALPNGDILKSVAQGELPIQHLTPLGKTAYVLKDLNTSLISLG